MTARIRLRWSKKERDVEVHWDAGCQGTAGMVLTHFTHTPTLHNSTFVKELEQRGYDVTTLRFSIAKKEPLTLTDKDKP